jgi:hypothetical protein
MIPLRDARVDVIDAEPLMERGTALGAAWWNRAAPEWCDCWSAMD